jgi:phosphate/sulfate permease
VTIIMMWCLIPFVGFWIVYVILFLYKSVEAAMAYQFGVGERNRGKYNA